MEAWLPLAGVALGGAITLIVSLLQSHARTKELETQEQINARAEMATHRRELIRSWRDGIAQVSRDIGSDTYIINEAPVAQLPYSDWYQSLVPHLKGTPIRKEVDNLARSIYLRGTLGNGREAVFQVLDMLADEINRLEAEWGV